MDPNDGDLALIAELKRLDDSKTGAIPIASLSGVLQEAFERAHPLAACPVIDGQVCMQPADWVRFAARQEQAACGCALWNSPGLDQHKALSPKLRSYRTGSQSKIRTRNARC